MSLPLHGCTVQSSLCRDERDNYILGEWEQMVRRSMDARQSAWQNAAARQKGSSMKPLEST